MPSITAKENSAVLLIGHGRYASDTPVELIAELRACKQERKKIGDAPSVHEQALEARVRNWYRTPETDPYKFGLERIAGALQHEMPDTRIQLAFNEFCAPSIDEGIAILVAEGARSITLISTMFTPGGGHAERDIPNTVSRLQSLYPDVVLRYAWPFPLQSIAKFLGESLRSTDEVS